MKPRSAGPLLPFSWARQHGVLAVDGQHGIQIYCRPDTSHAALMEAYRCLPGEPALARLEAEVFDQRLVAHYQQESGQAQKMIDDLGGELDFYALAEELPQQQDLLDEQDDAPIIRLINALLSEAIKERASDIHIETYESELVIRFRIDGALRRILAPQRKLAALLVSRIKVMSKLDIAEKRVPQDGRMALKVGGRAIDVRVSVMPASHGERVVMRLLDKQGVRLELPSLGMTPAHQQALLRLIRQPHGIILVTGPTGSGKSTTLYTLLSQINDEQRNIMTIEDPVEYELAGIAQTQVNPKVDMTFARGLRALLRQDPDVVLIGEIRDGETAQIAVQASLTGHLVLSTLHTNTAIGAVTRLRDMGVEPFLLSSSLSGVLAQRLVRRLCPQCREPYALPDAQRRLLGLPPTPAVTCWRPLGCEACGGQGYHGRIGLHELLVLDEPMRMAIHRGEGELDIAKLAAERYLPLRQDGIAKMRAGETSLEEVLRVTREGDGDEV
ncbi:type II secretion system ATPase GspE [Serratia marcescens]|uniref:Type II secretion system protein E n=1 Tax=Serratia marcescens TaxID=615 RepID=A0AA46K7B9_SERMA|nr:type II secretion system ATPase GspE [Serratia marcescens]TQI85770.1 general secretion pathway protein E [Serratia marcescens]BEO79336.1 type II secretion system protein GspE [Serratia marcescens]HEJ7121165.1 type II secretion system ATPase GspE [Serratia marcescens]